MKLKTKILIGFLFYFAIAMVIGGIADIKTFPMAIIGIAIGYFTFKFMRRKQAEAEEEEQLELERQLAQETKPEPRVSYRLVAMDGDGEEEEDEDEDVEVFTIKGINFANIDDSYIGDHDGYIKAVTDNPKDPYAIAVYVEKKRVGWLPGGNSMMHSELLDIGGRAKVHLTIDKSYDSYKRKPFYHGKVFVQK